MTYQQTLDWLFTQLPMYQRIGGANYKIDLEKTHLLMDLLGHPENGFKSIHVAGTNGKGSVSHMLASVLQEQGLKVGLYTSPHLKDFRERIKINGQMISEAAVVDFVTAYKDAFTNLQLSFFEMTVGLAFAYFKQEQVDIAIIEVGMGGRLDSTNVITPLVSVITNIGYDHMAFLGDTLEKIAGEKAGIIKNNVPVVIGKTQSETAEVFKTKAALHHAPIIFADQQKSGALATDLMGSYQKENSATAYTALMQLPELFKPSEEAISKGFANTVANTGLRGRWQIINQEPLCIADTAHNLDGLKVVLQQLEATPHAALHLVIGMVQDKDVNSILALFPKNAHYYFCQPNLPRALAVENLANMASAIGLRGGVYSSVKTALEAALASAQKEDVVFVGGSTFVVAEAL